MCIEHEFMFCINIKLTDQIMQIDKQNQPPIVYYIIYIHSITQTICFY